VLLLLVNKRWRALSTLAGGTVCLLGLCFAVLGNWVPSYWALLTREQGGGAEVAAFPQAMHNFRALVLALDLAANAQSLARLCLTLAALAVAGWICWPRKSLSTTPAAGALDFDVRFSLLLLLGLLISPHTYLHDLLLWLVAGVLLLGAARRLTQPLTRNPARILRGLLWAGSPIALLGYQVWLFYPIHLTVTYMLLVILLGVLLLARHRQVLTAR
jgi:hypothetical protein